MLAGIALEICTRGPEPQSDASNLALSWGNLGEGKEAEVPREPAAGVKSRRGAEFSQDGNRIASWGGGLRGGERR